MTMKFVKNLFSALLVTTLSSYCFSAAYMKIEGVEGEAIDKDHKGWIDVLSVSGLAAQNSTRDAASGLPTGKRQHKPLTIVKEMDKSSPLLARSSGNSQFPKNIVLSQNGIAYELSGVSVKSVRKKGDKEELVLTYTGIKQSSATDYNSSRSNRGAKLDDPANHNVTRSNKRSQLATPANHNSTRSNKTRP